MRTVPPRHKQLRAVKRAGLSAINKPLAETQLPEQTRMPSRIVLSRMVLWRDPDQHKKRGSPVSARCPTHRFVKDCDRPYHDLVLVF